MSEVKVVGYSLLVFLALTVLYVGASILVGLGEGEAMVPTYRAGAYVTAVDNVLRDLSLSSGWGDLAGVFVRKDLDAPDKDEYVCAMPATTDCHAAEPTGQWRETACSTDRDCVVLAVKPALWRNGELRKLVRSTLSDQVRVCQLQRGDFSVAHAEAIGCGKPRSKRFKLIIEVRERLTGTCRKTQATPIFSCDVPPPAPIQTDRIF